MGQLKNEEIPENMARQLRSQVKPTAKAFLGTKTVEIDGEFFEVPISQNEKGEGNE